MEHSFYYAYVGYKMKFNKNWQVKGTYPVEELRLRLLELQADNLDT